MAIHLSAIKRARQNRKRRIRNVHIESTAKSAIKRVRTAIDKRNVEEAQSALSNAIPLIQKGQAKGVFHKNTAARKISRLARGVNALKPPTA